MFGNSHVGLKFNSQGFKGWGSGCWFSHLGFRDQRMCQSPERQSPTHTAPKPHPMSKTPKIRDPTIVTPKCHKPDNPYAPDPKPLKRISSRGPTCAKIEKNAGVVLRKTAVNPSLEEKNLRFRA